MRSRDDLSDAFCRADTSRLLLPLDSANQIGDVKKENLPGIEALGRDGKKEGEVLMVKNEKNVVEAHQVRGPTRYAFQADADCFFDTSLPPGSGRPLSSRGKRSARSSTPLARAASSCSTGSSTTTSLTSTLPRASPPSSCRTTPVVRPACASSSSSCLRFFKLVELERQTLTRCLIPRPR